MKKLLMSTLVALLVLLFTPIYFVEAGDQDKAKTLNYDTNYNSLRYNTLRLKYAKTQTINEHTVEEIVGSLNYTHKNTTDHIK